MACIFLVFCAFKLLALSGRNPNQTLIHLTSKSDL